MTDRRIPSPPNGQESPAFCFVCLRICSHSAPPVAPWIGAGRDRRKSSPREGSEEQERAAARLSCRKVREVCTR